MEKKLSLAEEKYQETIQLFRERLRALYISGASSIGTLEILLSSSSFTDFFRKQKLTQVMAEHDQELLNKLNEYAEVTQGDRDALVEAQKQVADSQKAIEAAQNELKDLYAENEVLVSSLQSQQADAQAQIAENENRGRRPCRSSSSS